MSSDAAASARRQPNQAMDAAARDGGGAQRVVDDFDVRGTHVQVRALHPGQHGDANRVPARPTTPNTPPASSTAAWAAARTTARRYPQVRSGVAVRCARVAATSALGDRSVLQ